jgi:hypothetical protein
MKILKLCLKVKFCEVNRLKVIDALQSALTIKEIYQKGGKNMQK